MSARAQILARLRAGPSTDAAPAPDVGAWYRSHSRHEDTRARAARLRAALEAVHTEVYPVHADHWVARLLEIAAEKGLRNLLIGSDTVHGAALQASAPSSLHILRYEAPIEAWQDLLFDGVDASLTLARSALAETGSLILWPSASEPRLMSLVPPVHFVLLDADTIHADFLGAMQTEGWADGMPTNAVLVCGPSKTADIQQTLAYGAHGPRQLVVLLRHNGV
ncbi:MAG: LutC/YkgG family protein, partial [Rhodoferax sp.]